MVLAAITSEQFKRGRQKCSRRQIDALKDTFRLGADNKWTEPDVDAKRPTLPRASALQLWSNDMRGLQTSRAWRRMTPT
jgi:hypothetical protein